MSYTAVVRKLNEVAEVNTRTNWACKAHGCPNAASMAEKDLCYAHWRESDPTKWHEVTQRNREDFDRRRNWGEQSTELQAEYKATAKARLMGAA